MTHSFIYTMEHTVKYCKDVILRYENALKFELDANNGELDEQNILVHKEFLESLHQLSLTATKLDIVLSAAITRST